MTRTLADERMSDVDALVWAVEREPRHRTTIAALARFREPLDPDELRHRVDRATRVVPRLRQRVVPDPLGIAAPRWSFDPEFRLSFHLRRVRLGRPDRGRELALVRDLIVQPFDRAHPPWEFTLIDGLADGGSALLLKSHHAISDGVGGVELMLELFDLTPTPDPDRRVLPDAPLAPPTTAPLLDDAVRHETVRILGTVRRSLDTLTATSALPDLAGGARRLGEMLGSAARMYRHPAVGVLPDTRSAELDVRTTAVPLDDLRSAGARIDGTINDAFVTAVALAVADHNRDRDAPLRMAIPINTRPSETAPGTGNHWTPGRISLTVAPGTSPDAVGRTVRTAMRRLRHEPAHDLLSPIAAGARRLPDQAAAALFGALSAGIDVAASNVPGPPVPLRLCGQDVAELVPFGPLSGAAVNVTLLSHAGTAHVGISSDPAAVDDPDRLLSDVEAAFNSVIKGS